MTTPTNRALDLYRSFGYIGDEVERRYKFGKVAFKRDFLGIGDAILFHEKYPPIILQATEDKSTKAPRLNHDARLRKIHDSPFIRALSKCDLRIHVVSWSQTSRRITSLTFGNSEILEQEIDLPNGDVQ